MKKLGFVTAVIAALVMAGCASTGGAAKGEPEEDIGNEWTLDLTRLSTTSWSDGDPRSKNPPADTAPATENPNGGWDFTFTMYNQRIIFVLSRPQLQKIRRASEIEVIIDGESNGSHKFRYHIGDSEVGSDWNASMSFDESEFSTIVNRTIKMDKSRGFVARNFMIQTRGENTGVDFTPPETVTIRSIKFICK